MSTVVSFENYRPPKRHDGDPWTEVQIYEAAAEDGTYAQIDTVALLPLDSDPADPLYRDFTTSAGTADEQWYRVVFADASGGTSSPTLPVQNLVGDAPEVTAYATTEDLADVLKIRSPTGEQEVRLQRCLDAAALEIDKELGLAAPYTEPPALVVEVNIERAVEHWQQGQQPFGIVGMGDTGAAYIARDSWDRHAHKLAPLKVSWGIA